MQEIDPSAGRRNVTIGCGVVSGRHLAPCLERDRDAALTVPAPLRP